MAFSNVINTLRQEEQNLAKQLSSVRAALSALGSNIPHVVTGRGRKPGLPSGSKKVGPVRKRGKLSAKGRAAISKAQKLRWAKLKASKK